MRVSMTTFGSFAALLLAAGSALAQPGAAVPAPPAPLAPSASAPVAAPAPVAGVGALAPPDAVPVAATAASDTDDRPGGFIPQLSLGGAVGLLRMSSAEVGPVGQFRLGLHGEFFTASNFLVRRDSPPGGDRDTRVQGAFGFGATPLNYLELFGAISASENRNRRLCGPDSTGKEVCMSEPNRTDLGVIRSLGSLTLGAKFAYPLAPGFSAGAELGIHMLPSATGMSFSPDSTSLWVSALATYDLKPVTETVPLRLHFNLGYYLDSSKNLQNYDAANTSATSRYVSRFAYGISQNRFRLALGVDAPFGEVVAGFSLRPMIEYHFEYLNGSKDQVIYDQEHLDCGTDGVAACAENRTQHWVTLGVQGQILHGLTLTLGLDIAIRSPGYAYGPSLAPWNLLFGLGYPIDLVTRVVTRHVPVEKFEQEQSLRNGLVAGRITTTDGTPIESAMVGVTGRLYSRVLTDPDGTFQSVPLSPGSIELVIGANGYETVSARLDVIAGQTANVAFTLTPRAPPARAMGRIVDGFGKGVVAALKLAGPQIAEARSDEAGNFAVSVQPGQYVVRIDADQCLSKVIQLSVVEGKENPASITLRSRPAVAGLVFLNGKFKLRQPVTFKLAGKTPTAEPTVAGFHLLDEVADVLVNHPEIRQLRIEAHWDSSLPSAKAEALTDAQAKAVAKYLVNEGVGQERVVSVGMGAKKPVVPNLGKAARLKNRRIEFVVAN